MYWVKTPQFIQRTFPNFTWRVEGAEKAVYLTFDDGPTPGVTPWVMEELAQYGARATFFCLGSQVEAQPQMLYDLRTAGHAIGNHSHDHLDGWVTENSAYFRNVRKAAHLVDSALFRPPYGRIRPSQARFLGQHYQIVMWDILSGDFDVRLDKEKCLSQVLGHVRPGSIIVFHDNLKSADTLRYVLPRVLAQLDEEGYEFRALDVG